MPYVSNGTLTTDKRTVGDTATWDSQAEWEAYQSRSDVEIVSGALELRELSVPSLQGPLVHRWPLSEGSGSTAGDTVGSADMSLQNFNWLSGTWAGGWAGEGDADDHAGTASIPGYGSALNGEAAIEFTIETSVGSQDIMGIRDTTSGPNFVIGMGDTHHQNLSSGVLGVWFRDGNGDEFGVGGSQNVGDGNKHRVAVNKLDNSTLEFWIDGSLDASRTINSAVSYADFVYDFAFWVRNLDGTLDSYANATMDDIAFYSGSLTSSEIQNNHDVQPWSP